MLSHNTPHNSNFSYNSCNKPRIQNYIDDTYGVIKSTDEKVWKDIAEYINRVNIYYNNNKLINNKIKTKIMILTKNSQIKKKALP